LPIGKVLYDTAGWIGHPRVSPRGDRVAFIDHPVLGDDGGSVAVVDRAGKKTSLSGVFASMRGLAWSPSGSEIWFTAAQVGANRAVYGVTLSHKVRVVARVTGSVTVHDVSRDGRALVSHEAELVGFLASGPGDAKERDLSWLDYGNPTDISRDGKTVLFFESGEGGGAGYSVYLRRTDGSPAVRLGEGGGGALSPDGKWALAIFHNTTDAQLILYPTGAGEPKLLSPEGLKVRGGARWLPDGRRILMAAAEEGHGVRIYVRDVEGGRPRAITPERYGQISGISPDGKRFIARGPDRRFSVCPLEGGEPTPIPGLAPDDFPVGWTDSEQVVYVRRGRSVPARIDRLDITTGRSEKWRDIAPADMTGLISVGLPRITPDGRSYAYSAARLISALFLVDGMK
jgi:eukaryotic-like serine/threonine-protein kinase